MFGVNGDDGCFESGLVSSMINFLLVSSTIIFFVFSSTKIFLPLVAELRSGITFGSGEAVNVPPDYG